MCRSTFPSSWIIFWHWISDKKNYYYFPNLISKWNPDFRKGAPEIVTQLAIWTAIPANIRLDKDDLRTSRRPLQRNNFSISKTSSRLFKDVFKTLTKTSSWRLQDFEDEEFLRSIMTKTGNHFVISLDLAQQTFVLVKTYGRRLQCNIFLSTKTSWRHDCKTSCKHVLKTSWRRFRTTYCKYVLKTSSRRLGKQKVLRWRRLQDVLKTSWKTRNVCWVLMLYIII